MNLTGLAGIVKDAAGVDLVAAFNAAKSGDVYEILRYDVEPALKIAGELDPPLSPVMAIATFGIEVLIAVHKTGLLDDLALHLPSVSEVFKDIDLRGADPQTPAMQRAAGNENPQI